MSRPGIKIIPLLLVLASSSLFPGCQGERSVELSHPWLFGTNAAGEWVPRQGLVWTNRDDPDDYSVQPAPGYVWASNPGEDLIGPDGELLAYYSGGSLAATGLAGASADDDDGALEQRGEIIVEWIKLEHDRISRYNSRVRVSVGVRGDLGRRGLIAFRIKPGTGDASVFGSIPIVSDAPVVSSEISFVPRRTGTAELIAHIGDEEVGSATIYVSAE